MTPIFRRRGVWAAASLAAVLGLSACGDKASDAPAASAPPAAAPANTATAPSSTPGEKLDSAIARTEQAADSARASASASTAEARADASAATARAGEAMKDAGAQAKDTLSAAGTALGNAVDDATITASVSANLARDPDLSALRIDVDTQRGAVTLTGPAPTEAAKARAEQIAKAVNGVTGVSNKLEIKPM